MTALPSIQSQDNPCEWGENKETNATQKSSPWEVPRFSLFDRMQPSEQAVPFLLSAICLYFVARHTFSLLQRDIKNLTLVHMLEENILQTQDSLTKHTFEIQKETIHLMRQSTIYKIIAKMAFVSSFALLTLAEYWNLAETPVRNLRFYSLLSAAVSGSAVIYLEEHSHQ